MPENPSQNLPGNNPLINRLFLSPQQKEDKQRGKEIVKAFYQKHATNAGPSFFTKRNTQWIQLLLWAKGSQQMQDFLDYMYVTDANRAWAKMDMTPTRLAAKFVGTLVESMAKNEIYPCVSAIDDGSLNEKETRLLEALFRMHEVETIKAMQDQSGIQVEPTNAYVPDDELSAKVYFELEDRLPKEIKFEELLNYVSKQIKFDTIANPKALFYLIVLNYASTKIEKIGKGKYTVCVTIPTQDAYNYFQNDTGEWEISERGHVYSLKVKDFRRLFSKSDNNPDGLTEEEVFKLAKLSTVNNKGVFNYLWNDQWGYNAWTASRPYDDNNIYVLDCEIDCGEDVYYVTKTDASGKENISEKTGIPYASITKKGEIIKQPKPDNASIEKRQRNSWMRGVYCPYGDMMLYWGRPDLIISEYGDPNKCLSSYTTVIPNNDGEYVPSLFERIMEPLREYQLAKLKRKQLIAQLTQTGYKIDVESARNIDLGEGDTISWDEVLKIKLQTGIELFSSKGVNPLEREAPAISQGTPDDTIQKISGLTETMNAIGMEIRDLIGVPVYRDGADVGDRTAARLAEGQNKSSFNVTDFILRTAKELWQQTFYKICLLHWNDIVKEEPSTKNDMINTRFDVSVKMKMTEYEKELLEADIQRYSQVPDAMGNPSLTLKDAIMVREIDDNKKALLYLDSTYKKNRRNAEQEARNREMGNMQVQSQAAQQKAESDAQLQEAKLAAEKDLAEFTSTKQKELELLKGLFIVAAKDESGKIVQQFMPAIQQLVPNITFSLQKDTQDKEESYQQEEMQKEQAAQQQEMQQQQLQQQQDQQSQPM